MAYFVKLFVFKTENVVIILFAYLVIIQVARCDLEINPNSEKKTCAILYSEDKGKGSKIKISEEKIKIPDVSRGFSSCTGSIKVALGCKMKMCNAPHLGGTCETLEQGNYYQSNLSKVFEGRLGFVECTCSQVSNEKCKCSHIFMKKSSCARAYLERGCNTCHAPYVELNNDTEYFPDEFVGKVKALTLRKGCNLTLYSGEDLDGTEEIISSEVLEGYKGLFRSFECQCNDAEYVPRVKISLPTYYPVSINIPSDKDELIRLMKTAGFKHHPGLQSAFQSYKNGRSSRNAYVLLLGIAGSGKTSTINSLLGVPHKPSLTTAEIQEHRIKIPVDELGIGNSELIIIDTPGILGYKSVESDAKFLASFDAYLSIHEELKTKIPNVVLIFQHFLDNAYRRECDTFPKMLDVYKSLLERITDKNYSNVIFVFPKYCSQTLSDQSNPTRKLNEYKRVIENHFQFPRPSILVVAENRGKDQELPMIDGYYRLPNKELYPKNLIDKMLLVAQNGQDLIGYSVLQTAFKDVNFEFLKLEKVSYPIATNDSVKVDEYLHKLLNLFCPLKILNVTQPRFPNDPIAGFGYHLFNDTPLPTSPFKQGNSLQSDIGFMIPDFISVNLNRNSSTNIYIFDSQKEYIEHRLTNLGLKGKLLQPMFNGELKPGHNIKNISFRNDSCTLRFTRDLKLFQFILNDGRDFTNEFLETVYQLPLYTEDDSESVEEWHQFFNLYGTHVVHSIYGGGSIQIELHSDTPCNTEIGHALLDMIYLTEEMPFLVEGQDNGSIKRLFKDGIFYSLTFLGGDSQFSVRNSTEISVDNAAILLSRWEESLRTNPVTLPALEMKLIPLSQVVEGLGQGVSSEIHRAANLHFKSSIKQLKGNEETNGVAQGDMNFIQATTADRKKLCDEIYKVFQNTRNQQLENFSMLMEQLFVDLDRNRENENSVNVSFTSKIREFVEERQHSEHLLDRLDDRSCKAS
ncbi:unnamed protein product [Orchesella dallaii]|uniref:MACPF domain-containing protein n=1 Tax=Orchesella dallaii TaxID=48710 RepID=A0ABP1RYS3_9HEXA